MDTFETSPQTPQMADARRLLKRRAAHQDELDLVDGLVAVTAFNALEMAWPPFPPIGDVSDLPLPTAGGRTLVLAQHRLHRVNNGSDRMVDHAAEYPASGPRPQWGSADVADLDARRATSATVARKAQAARGQREVR